METSEDKHWASKYLLDPLNAPEPSAETGPGTHFDSTLAPTKDDKKQPQTKVEEIKPYPSPPHSTSPHRSRFPDFLDGPSSRNAGTSDRQSTEIPTSTARTSEDNTGRRRRGTSLTERYAGDDSHRPLDIIRKQSLRANRSPHLRKDRHHGLDSIDKLGDVGFHLEGPYDVVSLARNSKSRGAPVSALTDTNGEALRATPQGNVADSVQHHRPLDGVAQIPPGVPDRLTGKVYNYEEGPDMQQDTDRNRLNHWPGVDYHPDDRKGKGEPSFSIERALKSQKHGRHSSEGGIEMRDHSRRTSNLVPSGNRDRASSGTGIATGNEQSYSEWESGIQRSSSARPNRLASRFGSLTRRHRPENVE